MATFPSEQIDVTMTINADEEEAKVDSSGVVVAVKNSDGEENIDDEDDKDDDGEEEEDGVLEEASDTVDDDPVAEGEEHRMPKPEPSEEKANSTKFYTLCLAMEQVWEASVKNKKWSDLQKLWKILPPKVLSWLSEPIEGSNRPESVFPIMRLLLPDKDGSRQFQLAESTLGLLYGGALGLSQQSHKLQMLLHFTDRNIVRTQADGRGDFSVVVQRVVETTKAKGRASGYTVGAMNAALDVLASLPGKLRSIKSNHDWRPTSSEQSGRVVGKKSKGPTLKDLRIQWLKRLNEGTDTCHGLSPLEHKWLVRILLKKLQFGLVSASRLSLPVVAVGYELPVVRLV